MKVRITSVNGETLEDTIASAPHRFLLLALEHEHELKLVTLCLCGKAEPASPWEGKQGAKRQNRKAGSCSTSSLLHRWP